MDWKALGEAVAKLGLPLLGAALPIPGGAAIGAALAASIGSPSAQPEDILSTLTANADAVLKAKQFEAAHSETMLKLSLDAQVAQTASVNRTLQTEAMGGSFWQRNHHAFECIAIVCLVGAIYFVLPILGVTAPAVPESAWLMLGAIVGVTAWQRGQANIAAVPQ